MRTPGSEASKDCEPPPVLSEVMLACRANATATKGVESTYTVLGVSSWASYERDIGHMRRICYSYARVFLHFLNPLTLDQVKKKV